MPPDLSSSDMSLLFFLAFLTILVVAFVMASSCLSLAISASLLEFFFAAIGSALLLFRVLGAMSRLVDRR